MKEEKYLKLLLQVRKRAGKEHKACKDFAWGCVGCQRTIFLGLLDYEIDLIKWFIKQ